MNQSGSRNEKLGCSLDLILEGVLKFGSALNAMDRGFSGEPLEAEGHVLIRNAFQRSPELSELLPRLAKRLQEGQSVAEEGFEIRDEVEAVRKLIREG
jgi:hypothetical protein